MGEITETTTKLTNLAENLKNPLSKSSFTDEDVEFNEEEIKIKKTKKKRTKGIFSLNKIIKKE